MASTHRHSNKYYWYCQGIGWGVYTLTGFGFASLYGSPKLHSMIFNIAISLMGLVLTHAYRSFIKRQGWLKLNMGQIILRVLPACVVIGMVWFVANTTIWRLLAFINPKPVAFTLPLALSIIFNVVVVTFMWSLLYFGWHFFKNYKQAEIDQWKMASMAQEAQLMALKAQINPHFMFNALNNIRALILEDPTKAREMLTSLSELMRYSLRYSNARQVSLANELTVVDSYLQLASIQFEDRLQFENQINPAIMDVQVPPMLVQTLVENGIKHGIAQLPQGGKILLKGTKDNGIVTLEVENTGSLALKNTKESTGTGLQNVRERLQMLYGTEAQIKLSEKQDKVNATVLIPSKIKKIK
ncbi:sensor histidine kinase [uncultured Microscilla sp.]|uniref:sensor histidine kinase n=1 Tax=uncultured Microscilla sp. TaxID=432653 RepID=UPI00262E3A13|nr:histidine kinase [uncultured Microscilla sp.]